MWPGKAGLSQPHLTVPSAAFQQGIITPSENFFLSLSHISLSEMFRLPLGLLLLSWLLFLWFSLQGGLS